MNRQADASERALGERIQALRDFRGWAQEDFAFRSGLDRADLADVERGVGNPTLRTLEAMARCLGVTVSELLAGIERL